MPNALFLGDDGALDAQRGGAFLAVGLDFDALLEGAGTADGAVSHLDFALLARLDGLGGIFRTCAAARGHRVDNQQRLVARVGELKGAAHGAFRLLDGAEVMAQGRKRCLGLLAVGHGTQRHQTDGEYRHKKPFSHCHIKF